METVGGGTRMEMVMPKTWAEFRDTKLLWWINRILHTFGWAIVAEVEIDSSTGNETVLNVYPARVRFRGFGEDSEARGFVGLTKYLAGVVSELEEEAQE